MGRARRGGPARLPGCAPSRSAARGAAQRHPAGREAEPHRPQLPRDRGAGDAGPGRQHGRRDPQPALRETPREDRRADVHRRAGDAAGHGGALRRRARAGRFLSCPARHLPQHAPAERGGAALARWTALAIFHRLLRVGAGPAAERAAARRLVCAAGHGRNTVPRRHARDVERIVRKSARLARRAASQNGYTIFMKAVLRLAAASLLLWAGGAVAQQEEALLLIAHPAFRDLEYRQTVLIAAPAPNGGHVGVILNRPTKRSLGSLFPEHEPSKKVVEPVYYGGPFSRGALVALVRADHT